MKILARAALSAAFALTPAAVLAGDGYSPSLVDVESVTTFALPVSATAKAVDRAGGKGEAHRFAVGVPVALTSERGTWSDEHAGASRWRLRLLADGASSLSARVTELALPEGAALYVYDSQGALVQGPLAPSGSSTELWTPLIRGGEMVIEAVVPTADKTRFALRVAEVYYGYKDLQTLSAKRGSCNIDVACGEAVAWSDQVRSVALMTIAGQFACSAQAVNNAAGDLSGMLLTADHCGLRFDQNEGPTADSIVVYWNFQETNCGAGEGGRLDQFQVGGTLLARYAESDTALVRLNSNPLPGYNVFFGGIDARGIAPTSGAVIHHPSGEEKSLAVLAPGTFAARMFIEGQEVEGWVTTYEKGTTEQGSSGAGLLNEEGLIVGVLTAGYASCASPDGIDVFGRMDIGWNGGPEPEKSSLRFHLDPQNRCGGVIPGRDGSAGAATSTCETTAPQEDRPPEGDVTIPTNGMPRGSAVDFELRIANLNSETMSGVAFTLELPQGVRWASGVTRSQDCYDGQLFIQGQQLVMSGMRVFENSSCRVRTQIQGDVAGVYTVGLPAHAVTSSFGPNPQAIYATLTVLGYDAALEQFAFAADKPNPGPNEPVTLSWNIPAAASCDAFGEWSGARGTSGAETVELDLGAYVYRLICRTATGALERQVFVEVTETPNPPPPPGGSIPDGPSGGGALGWPTVLSLLTLILARRRFALR